MLGLTGSIAVYKSCELVRRLKDGGAQVFCLMSSGAEKFVSPVTFRALSGNKVFSDIWDQDLWSMAHLELVEESDLFIISPASANCLARLASGMADDMVSAAAISTRSPILIAPAMHETMWLNPATQSNVKRLKKFGHHFAGPVKGVLSRGDVGWGRLADTKDIIAAAQKILSL